MSSKPQSSWFRRTGLLAAFAGGVVVCSLAASRFLEWQQSRLASALADRAANASAESAAKVVRELAALGPAAIDPLVRLATSADSPAAQASRKTLLDEFAILEARIQKQSESGLVDGQQLLALASSLESHAEGLDESAARWLRRLGLKLVRLSPRITEEDSIHLVAACDRILAAKATRSTPPAVAYVAASPDASDASRSWDQRVSIPTSPAISPDSSSDMAIVRETTPAPPQSIEKPKSPEVKPSEPPLVEADSPAAAAAKPLASLPTTPTVIDVPPPRQVQRTLARLRQLSNRELADRLPNADRYEALAIQEVLSERRAAAPADSRRGLATAPPSSAKEVLARLHELPADQARAALRQLITNPDVDIRLEAITILATTSDPQIAELLQQRAVEDADARVADLANKILRERK